MLESGVHAKSDKLSVCAFKQRVYMKKLACVSCSLSWKFTSFWADAVSHIRTVLSNEPDASKAPLGENSTVYTAPVWP